MHGSSTRSFRAWCSRADDAMPHGWHNHVTYARGRAANQTRKRNNERAAVAIEVRSGERRARAHDWHSTHGASGMWSRHDSEEPQRARTALHLEPLRRFGKLATRCPSMFEVFALLDRFAP